MNNTNNKLIINQLIPINDESISYMSQTSVTADYFTTIEELERKYLLDKRKERSKKIKSILNKK